MAPKPYLPLSKGTGGGVGWKVECHGSGNLTDECTTSEAGGVGELSLSPGLLANSLMRSPY